MQLYTCSYYQFTPEMGVPVRTSLGLPKFRPESKRWRSVWALTPRWGYWNAEHGEFDKAFLAQLDRYGVDAIRTDLAAIAAEANADVLVLLCFERRVSGPEDCHRRLFAEWWEQQTGDHVPELDPDPQQRFVWGPGDIEITPPPEEDE